MKYEKFFINEGYGSTSDLITRFVEDIKEYPQIVEIIEKAKDRDDAIKTLYNNRLNILTTLPPFTDTKTLDKTQFFAVMIMSADFELRWELLNDIIKQSGCEVIKTDCDCASTKVGNRTFSILINNCCGDGVTTNIIDEEGTFNDSFFGFQNVIEGKFYIYDYDCGDTVVKELKGRYFVYAGESIILFKKERG